VITWSTELELFQRIWNYRKQCWKLFRSIPQYWRFISLPHHSSNRFNNIRLITFREIQVPPGYLWGTEVGYVCGTVSYVAMAWSPSQGDRRFQTADKMAANPKQVTAWVPNPWRVKKGSWKIHIYHKGRTWKLRNTNIEIRPRFLLDSI
jgi:hypothetical protein